MSRLRLALGPALLALACTPAQPAPDIAAGPISTPQPAPPPPAPPPPAPSPAPPAPLADDDPDPTPPPVVARPVTTPTPGDLAFTVAAYRDGYIDIHRLGDEVFVSGAGGLVHADRRGRLVPLAYGLSGQAEPWLHFDAWNVHTFGGRWPDEAWLVTEFFQSRGASPPLVHRRVGDVWQQVANKTGMFHWSYEAVLPWTEGRVLGLRVNLVDPEFVNDYEDTPKRVQKKIDAQRAALHSGFDLLGETPTPTTMVLDPAIGRVTAVASAPTGELFLLGNNDVYENDAFKVQRWGLTGPAAARGTTDTLPTAKNCRTLAVRAADEAYVGCTQTERASGLLRFDGATWKHVPAPAGMQILDLSLAPDGALWAVLNHPFTTPGAHPDDLWLRRTADAAWERVALPDVQFPDRAAAEWLYDHGPERWRWIPGDPAAAEKTWTLEPRRVIHRAPDDVWVVANTGMIRQDLDVVDGVSRDVVLRTKPAGEPLRMLHDGDLALEALDWRPAPDWQPGTGCGERPAFVALRTLPSGAPRDQPEPQLETFVRDNPDLLPAVVDIFEVHRRGRRAVGMFVDLTDRTAADALLAALERAAPGEPRSLECRRPRVRRGFDKTTGRPRTDPPTTP